MAELNSRFLKVLCKKFSSSYTSRALELLLKEKILFPHSCIAAQKKKSENFDFCCTTEDAFVPEWMVCGLLRRKMKSNRSILWAAHRTNQRE